MNVCFGKDGDTALHLACQKATQKDDAKKQERDEIVDLLLRHGANYNALNKNL